MKPESGWPPVILGGAVAMILLAMAPGIPAGAIEPGAVPARLLAPVSAEWPDPALFAEAVLLHGNMERARFGLAPLAYDGALGQAALDHARNMALLRTHSHDLPVEGQSNYRQRLRTAGVRYRAAGENIARGKLYQLLDRPIATGAEGCDFTYAATGAPVPIHTYASLGAEVVARWLSSPGHRATLLSARYQRTGAGIGGDPDAAACGDLYMAQTFAD